MWNEIAEQPTVLDRMLGPEGRATAARIASAFTGEVRYVLIAARGTSDNAARYAQYVWGVRNGLPVGLAAPSIFTTYCRPPSLGGALVVALSQSGRSPDVVAVVQEARAQGRPTLAITNDLDSPLANTAEHVFPLEAGPEHAVTATKTYTAELLAVAMLSAAIRGDVPDGELADIPQRVAAAVAGAEETRAAARAFNRVDRCIVLGRGFNLSTTFEWALKLQEACSIAAQPFSSVDFLHGPIAMIEEGFPVFAIVPAGGRHDPLRRLVSELSARRGADVLVVTAPGATYATGVRRIRLSGAMCEWISPIVAAVPIQLFSYHLAVERGSDPDSPHGLAKVTTTW
jgi:glucosamine--fructose-6-phosphate aminotransferase (isomerizing)